MNQGSRITRVQLSPHVIQFSVPTPTLPPAFQTNSYLIFDNDLGVLVDAGTQDEDLLTEMVTLIEQTGVTRIVALMATHYHRDHVQGLPHLQTVYGAPIYVHALDKARASHEMCVDLDDIVDMPHQATVGDVAIEIHHAPGHTHGHVHIRIPHDRVILVGDHLAGDGSVWIGPPDGHMAQYYEALQHIASSGCEIVGPGHGPVLESAHIATTSILKRRMDREAEICHMLSKTPLSIEELVQTLYGSTVPAEALWVARRTVKAHIEHLIDQGMVRRVFYRSEQCFRYAPM